MNLEKLAKIACYLNLATIITRRNGGDIQWLTGTSRKIELGVASRDGSQETQCISCGSAIWIANNHDGDTDTQRNLLNALGIKDGPALLKHVTHPDGYARRVFEAHAEVITAGAMTQKDKLFHGLIADGSMAAGRPFSPPTTSASNASWKLGIDNAVPAFEGLRFITGDYDGTGGDKFHAEQRLLAALGRLSRAGKAPSGEVFVGGVKSACATCKLALRDVYLRFWNARGATTLRYEDVHLDRDRVDVGLGPDANDGIRRLTLATYF